MTRSRCAIVGAGLMGRWHADAARRAGVEVGFIVDPDYERARHLSRILGLAANVATQSLDDALKPKACDAVHICTPLATHARLTRNALEAGRHVLVEKPLAESAAAAAELFALAEQHRVKLVPVHQFLFQPGVLRALRTLPTLGPVLHFEAVACSAGADTRLSREREQIARDILPHAFALAERLIGVPVGEIEWSALHPTSGELRLLGRAGSASTGIVISMSGRPTRHEATVICRAGTVHLNLFHGYAVIERGRPSRADKAARPFLLAGSTLASASVNLVRRAVGGETAYPGLRELVRRFYAAALHGGPEPITRDESLSVARAGDRVALLLGAASEAGGAAE